MQCDWLFPVSLFFFTIGLFPSSAWHRSFLLRSRISVSQPSILVRRGETFNLIPPFCPPCLLSCLSRHYAPRVVHLLVARRISCSSSAFSQPWSSFVKIDITGINWLNEYEKKNKDMKLISSQQLSYTNIFERLQLKIFWIDNNGKDWRTLTRLSEKLSVYFWCWFVSDCYILLEFAPTLVMVSVEHDNCASWWLQTKLITWET